MPLNGQKQFAIYGSAGLIGVSGFLSAFAIIINLFIAPLVERIATLDKILVEMKNELRADKADQKAEIAALRAELKRIGDLAAERGIELPRIRADLARVEADAKIGIADLKGELIRIRDHLDRIDQGQRVLQDRARKP